MAARPQSARVTKQAAREAGRATRRALCPPARSPAGHQQVTTGVTTGLTAGLTARCVTLSARKTRHRLEPCTNRAFAGGGWKATPVKGFQPSACLRRMPDQRYGVALVGAMPSGSNSHIYPQERVRRVIFLSLRAQQSRRPCEHRRNTTRLPRRLRLLAMTCVIARVLHSVVVWQ